MRIDLYTEERSRFLYESGSGEIVSYRLFNCIDGQILYTNTTECPLCQYNVGSYVHTSLPLIPCWYITEGPTTGETLTNIVLQEGYCEPCVPKCYTITGTGSVTYLNTFVEAVTTTAPVKICALSYPSVTGDDHQIFVGEECSYIEGCPNVCYLLTNCDTQEELHSTNQDLAFPYELGETVKLNEFAGCWTISILDGECTSPVTTTVSLSYDSCETCNPPTYYKLQSCGSSQPLTVFTSQDLSSYIGKTVKLEEYQGCFNVTVFSSTYPSPVTVTITYTYNDCPECEAKRYKLTDCDEIRPSIYTTTDLSAYLSSVIKLTFYPDTCWIVEETLVNTSDDLVIIDKEFTDCYECSIDYPCICSTVTNNSQTTQTFIFRDCDGNTNNIILEPGETSSKNCVLKWIFPENWTLPKIITNYGNCVNGECVVKFPFRSIRPGYNSPACSTQYYERIACEYAEILYKNVISERYGIAPCCPEDELYRLDIKFQLLELQAINNPDYICTPFNPCCYNNDSCGCGCNS